MRSSMLAVRRQSVGTRPLPFLRTCNSWQNGETALDMARSGGHSEVEAILESAVVSVNDEPLPGYLDTHTAPSSAAV
jgi:hypothetical protein